MESDLLFEQVKKANVELMHDEKAMQYLFSKGLSAETLTNNMIGYCPDGYCTCFDDIIETVPDHSELYKYVFPVFDDRGRCTDIAAMICDDALVTEQIPRYSRSRFEKKKVFNEHYLMEKDGAPCAIFICKDIIDALSIEECGCHAIAYGDAGYGRIRELCMQFAPDSKFGIVISKNGIKTEIAENIVLSLNTKGYPAVTCDMRSVTGTLSDMLIKDRQAFTERVRQFNGRILSDTDDDGYRASSSGHRVESLIEELKDGKYAGYMPTGFDSLDGILNGGLSRELMIVGGISGIGKTTFVQQIADHVAEGGNDVMVFSLEMTEDQMIIKSISRETFNLSKQARAAGEACPEAMTVPYIEKFEFVEDEEQIKLFQKASQKYTEYAKGHIFIIEPEKRITIRDIVERVRLHHAKTGKWPLVIIDYLQIIAAANERFSDKQNMDDIITKLKILSHDMPVIGISSYNRESYGKSLTLASFKESGSIEYTASVLIGIQYAFMAEKNAKADQELHIIEQRSKKGLPLNIQVKVIKNRFGYRDSFNCDFYGRYNYYEENRSCSENCSNEDKEYDIQETLPIVDDDDDWK